MFLIGQYDSPFARRTAIALRLYGLPFEHRPWSTFGDADKIAPYNPLLRVPVLVLDDGEALIDSAAILDHLDETVGPERAMLAPRGPLRRKQLRTIALATGLGDKAVSLIYERVLRKDRLALWVARCETQISGVLAVLEAERAGVTTDYWHGEHIGHADIAVACVLRFTREAHPHLFDEARYPALAAHAAKCEALPAFQDIVQPLARRAAIDVVHWGIAQRDCLGETLPWKAGLSYLEIRDCHDEQSRQLVTPSCPGLSRASTCFSAC